MSAAIADEKLWLTTQEVADRYRCGVEKILQWIAHGDLTAVNVAARGGGKPRWRISAEALAEFERRRSTVPPLPMPTRRTRKADNEPISFF